MPIVKEIYSSPSLKEDVKLASETAYFNFCWDNVGGIYKNYFFLPKKSGQPFHP